MTKFKIGDKAWKPKGYKFPCTIVSIFETTSGDTRIVAELDDYKMLHIFNEKQLEHIEKNSGAEVTPIPKGVITKPENYKPTNL